MSMNRRRKQLLSGPGLDPSWIVPAEHEDAIMSSPSGNDTYTATLKSKYPVEQNRGLTESSQTDESTEAGNKMPADSTSTGPGSSTSFHADALTTSNPPLGLLRENQHEKEALDAGLTQNKAKRKKRYAVQHSTQWITDESDEPTPTPKGADYAPAYSSVATSDIGEGVHSRTRQHGMFSRKGGKASPGYDAPAIQPQVASNYTPTGPLVHTQPHSAPPDHD